MAIVSRASLDVTLRAVFDAPEKAEGPVPIESTFPRWLAAWWRWSEAGLKSWVSDIPTVIGWAVVGVVLAVISPVVLVGVGARALVRRVHIVRDGAPSFQENA